jgi:hypothetical protein
VAILEDEQPWVMPARELKGSVMKMLSDTRIFMLLHHLAGLNFWESGEAAPAPQQATASSIEVKTHPRPKLNIIKVQP